MDIKSNPHCHQLLKTPQYDIGVQDVLPEVLEHGIAPRREYFKRSEDMKGVLHDGQRKLFKSELVFLTKHAKIGDTIVYAGAAPGTHIKLLSELFSTVKFVCIDPANFSIEETEMIEIRTKEHGMFDDNVAREFANQDVLFISDIRTADHHTQSEKEVTRRIKEDMENQMRWHKIIRPRYSMLKFKLPWDDGLSGYLDGDIYLPIWGPQSTTESRLVVAKNAGMKLYDHKIYEAEMFYHNTTTRVARYHHDVKFPQHGICHCFDCAAEIRAWQNYLKKYPRKESVVEMIVKLSKTLSSHRTLVPVRVDKEKKYKNISKHQHVNGRPAYEEFGRRGSSQHGRRWKK